MNPDVFIFDASAMETRKELVARHSLPYSDLDLQEEERAALFSTHAPIDFSHTLQEQIGGQMVLTDFDQALHEQEATAHRMPGYFATRAKKT